MFKKLQKTKKYKQWNQDMTFNPQGSNLSIHIIKYEKDNQKFRE